MLPAAAILMVSGGVESAWAGHIAITDAQTNISNTIAAPADYNLLTTGLPVAAGVSYTSDSGVFLTAPAPSVTGAVTVESNFAIPPNNCISFSVKHTFKDMFYPNHRSFGKKL